VFRRGLATYPHSPKMPATGSDRYRADPTRSSTALDTGARDSSDEPLGYGTYASGETSHDAQLVDRRPASCTPANYAAARELLTATLQILAS
jgi:hypothetical protein